MWIVQLVATLVGFSFLRRADATISCYFCTSRNGSDPNCEDPLNPALTLYKDPCLVAKEGHVGEFPANFCIKVIGKEYGSEEPLVIRMCALESMESQCGDFQFEDKRMHGCILTCDYDGCNTALMPKPTSLISTLLFCICLWLL